jgi:hypothetical protein
MLKNSHKICLHSNNHSEAGTVQGGAPYRVVKRKKCYAEEMCMGGKGRRNPATYICAEQRAFGTNSHRTIWPGERGEIKSLPTNTHRHSPIRTHLYLSYKMCLVNSLPMRDCTWPVIFGADCWTCCRVDFREFQRYSGRLQLYGNGQPWQLTRWTGLQKQKQRWRRLERAACTYVLERKRLLVWWRHGFPS